MINFISRVFLNLWIEKLQKIYLTGEMSDELEGF